MHNQDSCDCIRSLSIKLYSIYPFIGTEDDSKFMVSLDSNYFSRFFYHLRGQYTYTCFFPISQFFIKPFAGDSECVDSKKIELSNIKFNVATRISDVNQSTERDGKRLYIWILQSAFISSNKIQHLPIRPAKPSLP